MAVRVGCRHLLQAFRVQAADRDSACRLAASLACSRQYILSRKVSPSRLNGPGTATRHYSSDSKDDLRVRYLDGEDDGEFRSLSAPIQRRGVRGKAAVVKKRRNFSIPTNGS
ncbi:methylglutaconyl-CoA hydratase, mitochondrial [Lates japonicus]|uniref:Methylglutaconyl-CoA hydratase, mitochondrial n=1 Tax=Lates japonicus TaxID=270547 RepID=A0AAD3NLV4_LATJO|nr:methylglutaconyl-CoA hydratase, mitochondrial [Lates japonicus]